MIRNFIHEAGPGRVVFGSGTASRVADEVQRLGGKRALVLSTPGRGEYVARQVADRLGPVAAGLCDRAAMHTPAEVTARALEVVENLGADSLVAIGGGSAVGLSKALALRTGLPQIVLPTTYAGSEMTPVLGETKDGRKTTQRNPRILPQAVIYDVDLTLELPVAISVNSGMNAIAHALEGLYAKDTTPVVSLLAQEGIASLAAALPLIAAEPADKEARADALYGAFLCGWTLGATTMALHHKLAHVLGGMFNLPHAQTHAALLPHTAAYNAPAAAPAMARLEQALSSGDVPGALFDLNRSLGGAIALGELGMPRAGIGPAVEETLANPYWNPRPLDRARLTQLLERAWSGTRPSAS